MKTWIKTGLGIALSALALALPARADDDKIIVGFATAQSGFMQAYDKPAEDAARIRIDEINKAGGLLGKQIETVAADTKTDRAEGAKAGLEVLDKGADLVVVSCDYDFGAPAALAAEAAGKVSFFLCAESVKAGIQGVGPHSFSASVLAAVQGAPPVWIAVAASDAAAMTIAERLQGTFQRAGWRTHPIQRSEVRARPGLFVFAADESPPGYVDDAIRALGNSGIVPTTATGYRAYYEERHRASPDFKGFLMEGDQTYVIAVGRGQ